MRVSWGEFTAAIRTAQDSLTPCELSEVCGAWSANPIADGWYVDPDGAGCFCPACCTALRKEQTMAEVFKCEGCGDSFDAASLADLSECPKTTCDSQPSQVTFSDEDEA